MMLIIFELCPEKPLQCPTRSDIDNRDVYNHREEASKFRIDEVEIGIFCSRRNKVRI